LAESHNLKNHNLKNNDLNSPNLKNHNNLKIITHANPKSPVAEAYRILRTNRKLCGRG